MRRLDYRLQQNRKNGTGSVITFINGGDPDSNTTLQIMKLCAKKGVDALEIGVPFAKSCTDGDTIKSSHERALLNAVGIEQVLAMVAEFREEYATPVVLLADFDHSVKKIGIDNMVKQCLSFDIDGLLLHGLPPLYRKEFLHATHKHQVYPILSLYPGSSDETIARTVDDAGGYIYLVNQYGKSGAAIDFQSESIVAYYSKVKKLTDVPLMAGFGVSSPDDISRIQSLGLVDGVIIGSAVSRIIESALPDCNDILMRLEYYLDSILGTKYSEPTPDKEKSDESTKRNYPQQFEV